MNWGEIAFSVDASFFWIFLGGGFLLSVYAVWLAVGREPRRRLTAHLIATILAVFSLLLMALQPQWSYVAKPSEAILITPGADAVPVFPDSIAASMVFTLDEIQNWKSKFPEIKTVPDVAYIQRHFPEINLLHVFGHGLSRDDWQEIDSISIKPRFEALKFGIEHISWPREVTLGEKLRLQVTLAGLDRAGGKLYLHDLGGAVDSVTVSSDAPQFEFVTTPRNTGRFLYKLSFKRDRRQTLFEEVIDMNVIKPAPVRVLILENSVSFETKYLKNWLSKRKASLAIRSAISRDRFRSEFHNRPQTDLSNLTSRLLRDFDLIIIDAAALAQLSDAEQRTLRYAMEQDGLGMLIKPDESVFQGHPKLSFRDFFFNFHFEEFSGIDFRLIKPSWRGSRDTTLSAIPVEPFAIKSEWGIEPLVFDEMDRLVAAAHRRGEGLIGMSLIRDSYRWILDGRSDGHAAYWSLLISKLARKASHDRWSLQSSVPPIIDQPLRLAVETTANLPIGLVSSEDGQQDSLFLQQDFLEPQRWFGIFWPRAEGWLRVSTQHGKSYSFYVFKKENWQTWQQSEKIRATKNYAMQNSSWKVRADGQHVKKFEAVPLFYFFISFLLSSAFLWIERKL